MYGYRHANSNPLMTNLNSISSSISSIDTVGRRTTNKASLDNLINNRTQSGSTNLLWRSSKDERYSNSDSIRNARNVGSQIYHANHKSFNRPCKSTFDLILVPLLLLTITRQVFDFLGQIWLQIFINFLTTIIIIVALSGTRQRRVSYLDLFSLWALFNTVWNLMVLCVYTKYKDVGMTEETLSLYTGAVSWWQSNGPGCSPYNISSIKPLVGILSPSSIITGCRLDYHSIEAIQAFLHACLSFVASLISCCVRTKYAGEYSRKPTKDQGDKVYRLNNLAHSRSRVNQDPYPNHKNSRPDTNTASLRRAPRKTSSRSSQHSISSARSMRRRTRASVDGTGPIPRGSTSSAQRSQKYGSLSSKRSSRRDRRSDIGSLTYGVAGERPGTSTQRTRLSSLSSADYLPSYQPPHSSSANLLSSYGEVSSMDSYNNNTSTNHKHRQTLVKSVSRGNINPTYNGSRSSVCSTTNTHNYDDLSYIYGSNNNNERNMEGTYTSRAPLEVSSRQVQSRNNQQSKIYGTNNNEHHFNGVTQIQAETYTTTQNGLDHEEKNKIKVGGSFQSFTAARAHQNDSNRIQESNNNTSRSSRRNIMNKVNQDSTISNDVRSRTLNNPASQYSFSAGDRSSRYPIYSNQMSNNSETPI